MEKEQLEFFLEYRRPIFEDFDRFAKWAKRVPIHEPQAMIQGVVFNINHTHPEYIIFTKMTDPEVEIRVKTDKDWF